MLLQLDLGYRFFVVTSMTPLLILFQLGAHLDLRLRDEVPRNAVWTTSSATSRVPTRLRTKSRNAV